MKATEKFVLELIENNLNDYAKYKREKDSEFYNILKQLLIDKEFVGRENSLIFNDNTDNVAWVDVPQCEVFNDCGDVTCCYIQEIWVEKDNFTNELEIYVIFNGYYLGVISDVERLSPMYSAEILETLLSNVNELK
jgi:hypothetical protein